MTGNGAVGGPGRIVLVATPIGNLGDLSPRAVRTLEEAGVICCEDTRRTRALLTHAGVTGKRLLSLHEHNEDERVAELLELVGTGLTVAVVSDAGMPGISDPGQRLVAAAAAAGAEVGVVPGPSAVVAALVVSGLPTDRFCFEGFLPRSGRARTRRLAELSGQERTTVLYEAPGRVRATLADLVEACGAERPVAVVREISKVHEEVWRGTAGDAVTWAGEREPRGEVVLVVGGARVDRTARVTDDELLGDLAIRLSEGERTSEAVAAIAIDRGVPRRRVYGLAIESRAKAAEALAAASGAPAASAADGRRPGEE